MQHFAWSAQPQFRINGHRISLTSKTRAGIRAFIRLRPSCPKRAWIHTIVTALNLRYFSIKQYNYSWAIRAHSQYPALIKPRKAFAANTDHVCETYLHSNNIPQHKRTTQLHAFTATRQRPLPWQWGRRMRSLLLWTVALSCENRANWQ